MYQDADTPDYSALSLDELLSINVEVETASKKAEGVNDAPAVISLITAREIRQFGASNLKEVLNRVSGIYMLSTYFGFDNYTSIRGDRQSHYDTHTLILLNGRPFRDALFGGLNTDIYGGFPINIIERIEVIRGPGSVLYGTGAFSGVINIITRGKSKGTDIAVGGGSFSKREGQAVTRGEAKGMGYMVAASFEETDGWDFGAYDETGTFVEVPLPEKHFSVATDLTYHGFDFTALYLKSDEMYWGTVPVGTGAPRASERLFANLGYERKFTDTWTVETNLTLNTRDMDPDRSTTTLEETLLEVTGYGTFNRVNLIVGASGSRATSEWSLGGVAKDSRTDLSAYVQADMTVKEKLKLIAGAQLNKPDGLSSDVVPRIGGMYRIKEGQGIKLLYGEAFRSPAENETDFRTNVILGNPDLMPETVATTELQYFTRGANWWGNITAFQVKQNDLIGRVPNPTGESFLIYDNLGSGRFRGMELEGKYAMNELLSINVGYSYQQNENDRGVEDFAATSAHLMKLGLFLKPVKGVELGIFDNFVGTAPKVEHFGPNGNDLNPPADATHRVSANLAIDLKGIMPASLKRATFNIYARNLLDEDIYINEFVRRNVNTMPQDAGRSVLANLRLAF